MTRVECFIAGMLVGLGLALIQTLTIRIPGVTE